MEDDFFSLLNIFQQCKPKYVSNINVKNYDLTPKIYWRTKIVLYNSVSLTIFAIDNDLQSLNIFIHCYKDQQ